MLCFYPVFAFTPVFCMELRMTTTFPSISISTDRLVMRPFDMADIPAYIEMMNDELVVAWTEAPHPYTQVDAERWVRRIAPAQRTKGDGIVLAVTEFLTQRLVGSVRLRNTDWRTRATEAAAAGAALAAVKGAEAREKAAPLLAEARATAADKAAVAAALASERAAEGRDIAVAKVNELRGVEPEPQGSKLKKLLVLTGLLAIGGFVFSKLKAKQDA